MMIALFPILVAIVGLLMWFVSSNAKVSEAGRLMFFAGVLVVTMVLAKHVVKIS